MRRGLHCRSSNAALALLLVAGCTGAPSGGGGGATPSPMPPAPPPAASRGLGGPHVMRTHFPDRAAARKTALPQATGAHLTYYGGPVLGSVKVFTVFWNSQVNYQSELNGFYKAVTNSAYFDWLSEYNTPSATIGRGSFIGSLVDPAPPASTSLTNEDIQAELGKLIDAGQVPAPDGNTLYMVHFPPGVTISLGSDQSCVYFCAYHNTFVHNGTNVYYGVMPDQGGGCAGGCGGDPVLFNNLTSVSSHELIESVTDAAVGLATQIGPPLAWYDQTNGEIGDICNAEQGTVAGYTVQKEWSNKANACIVTAGACAPQCTGKQCGPDGCGGVCGTCDSGQTCDANGQCQGSTGECAHGLCTTGSQLQSGCDPCVTQICAQDSYCCTTAWDSICVGEVGSICGSSCNQPPPPPTCAHDLCVAGGKLDSSCDPCASSICAQDSYCCTTAWDSICVGEVGSICGKSCNQQCAHDECQTGGALSSGCDSCVTTVCTFDSYCCSTGWDSICVGEAGGFCGKSCS